MVYEAVLFDLDGTLVHTASEYRYKIVDAALSRFGRSGSREDIDRFWFDTERDEVIRESFGLNPDSFWSFFHMLDAEELRKIHSRPYDDSGFVSSLKERGYKTGILSGAPRNIIDLEVEMLEPHFDVVLRAHESEGSKPKPDPSGLVLCLSKLGVSRESAIYVGNGAEDVGAAKRARVLDVLVDRKEHDYNGEEPTYRINSLYDLDKILNGSSL